MSAAMCAWCLQTVRPVNANKVADHWDAEQLVLQAARAWFDVQATPYEPAFYLAESALCDAVAVLVALEGAK